MFRALVAPALLVAVTFSSLSVANADSCTDRIRSAFRSVFDKADWRSELTNRTGEEVKTTKNGETALKEYQAQIDIAVFNDGSTMPIEVVGNESISFDTLRATGNYGSHIYPKYEVFGVRKGRAGFILGLPVSGHVGADNARKWATTDLYNIRIEKEVNGSFTTENLISRQQSKGITTFHELNLQMEKGALYRISYWRDGSAGPHGYSEGRFVELIWNGQ